MAQLKELGFIIYRVRESRSEDEFILYNTKTKLYSTYNFKRLVGILYQELKDIDFDLREHLQIVLGDEQGKKINLKKVIAEWAEEEQILIYNLSYEPSNNLIIEDGHKKLFNVYQKSETLLNFKDNVNSFDNIKTLIMNIVGNDEKDYEYFIKWIAWQLQNPLKRLPTSIILQGDQGTGKTKFCDLILKNIFGNNFCEIGQTDINKDYNDFILGKQLIVANEVIHNDNKYLVPDKLKNYVTDDYLSINRKFKDTIYVKNFAQWIFVSNNDVPLKLEEGDRRYTVFKSKKLIDGQKLIHNIKKNLKKELNGFIAYMINLKVTRKEVGNPLSNKAKIELIKANWNSIQEFIYDIDILIEEYHYKTETDGIGTYISTNETYELYTIYCKKSGFNCFNRANFTRQIKKMGLFDGIKRINGKTTRVMYLKKNE